MYNRNESVEDKIKLEEMEGAHGVPEYNKHLVDENSVDENDKKWTDRVDEIFPSKPVTEPLVAEVVKSKPPIQAKAEPIKKETPVDIIPVVTKSHSGTLEPIIKDQRTLDLIKNTVAKGATNDELKLFIYTANKHGLDPLARQIHFVKRGTTATIQTGIDGYRAIAERTGQLGGISDVKFDSEDKEHPEKATVTILRLMSNGGTAEFTASARWSEYAATGNQGFMWKKMPYLMLGKCAEALALRKAFPHDLSGIYTQEEMQQSNNEETK